jgi:hypothetical protein
MGDEAQKRADDAAEYQRSLLGFLWDVSKTLGFTGLLVGLGGLITYAIMGKDGVEKNFGMQGMYFVNAISGFFGDPVYSDLVASQLTGDEVILGKETLNALLDNSQSGLNRAITLALLKKEGFNFENPTSLNMQMVEAALLRAATNNNGEPLEIRLLKDDGSLSDKRTASQAELDAYTGTVFSKLIEDLKTGNPQEQLGEIRKWRDWFSEKLSGEAKDYQTFGQDAALMSALIKAHPEQSVELAGLLIEDAEMQTFIQANQSAITHLVESLSQQDLDIVMEALMQDEASRDDSKIKGVVMRNADAILEFKSQLVANVETPQLFDDVFDGAQKAHNFKNGGLGEALNKASNFFANLGSKGLEEADKSEAQTPLPHVQQPPQAAAARR